MFYLSEGKVRATFMLNSKVIVIKIGYKPFDYDQAGGYDSKEWKQRATLDSTRLILFMIK